MIYSEIMVKFKKKSKLYIIKLKKTSQSLDIPVLEFAKFMLRKSAKFEKPPNIIAAK